MAAILRDHPNAVVTVPDLAKLTTRYYDRIPSYLHNRMLPLLPRARALICHTEWIRQEIERALRFPGNRVFVVPPFSRLSPPPFPLPRTPPAPTAKDPWTLLYVAVDRPHKNIELFLRLLSQLDARFRGRVVTRPTSRTLSLASRLGLIDRVTFESGLPDLAEVYRQAHLLVYPSLYEGFGLPLLEAMSQGLPVVSSSRTCLREVVGNGGTVLDPAEVAPWVEAVLTLTDSRRYAEASLRAVDRAREFTEIRSRDALLGAYSAAMR